MRRLLRTALLAGAAALVAFPAAAAAKELTQATVCGASGCNTITDRSALRTLPLGGESRSEPPAHTTRFFRVEVTIDHGRTEDRFAVYYVPAARSLATGGDGPDSVAWFPIYGSQALDAVQRATKGLEGYPESKRWPTTLASFERMTAAAPEASGSGLDWGFWLGFAGVLAAVLAAAAVVATRVRGPLRRHTSAA